MNISLRNSLGAVAELDFPALSPWLASQECADALWTLWGGPSEDPDYGAKYGLVSLVASMPILAGPVASQVRARMPESAAYKMGKWRETAEKIDPETGAFHGYSGEYYWALKVQGDLIRVGLIPKSEAPRQHPVDAVADFVTGNKWYWGVVLGASAVPPLMVAKDMLKENLRNEDRKGC